MRHPYKDKIAMVTGGASGLGLALCRELASRGARVVVADRNGSGAERAAADITAQGGRARAVTLDVTEEGAVSAAVEATAAAFGALDFFFNNAGIGVSADARDLTMEQWRNVMAVDLFGVLHGTLAAYRIMARQGFGRIVNVASMAGFAPFSMNTPYTTAKYGVVGFTQALRAEAADLGVRLTLVCPGIIKTPFYDAMEIIGLPRRTYLARLPRRLITPERAARIILHGVAGKKAMIIFPFHAKLFWWMSRLAPGLLGIINKRMVREFRSRQGGETGRGTGA